MKSGVLFGLVIALVIPLSSFAEDPDTAMEYRASHRDFDGMSDAFLRGVLKRLHSEYDPDSAGNPPKVNSIDTNMRGLIAALRKFNHQSHGFILNKDYSDYCGKDKAEGEISSAGAWAEDSLRRVLSAPTVTNYAVECESAIRNSYMGLSHFCDERRHSSAVTNHITRWDGGFSSDGILLDVVLSCTTSYVRYNMSFAITKIQAELSYRERVSQSGGKAREATAGAAAGAAEENR